VAILGSPINLQTVECCGCFFLKVDFMNWLSILFSAARKPMVADTLAKPSGVMQQGFRFAGGTMFVKGGVQIDAQFNGVNIESEDGGLVHVTALGNLESCLIKGGDVMISGDFTGEIVAKGDVEVTNTARIKGTIRAGGVVLVSPLSMDKGDVKILPLQRHETAKEGANFGTSASQVVQKSLPKLTEQVGERILGDPAVASRYTFDGEVAGRASSV
jgi:cytoskeletal protein CcmA (bactofilin family)